MKFDFQKRTVTENKGYKYLIYQEAAQITYGNFLELLHADPQFQNFFIDLLSEIPFWAYHWETPAVTASTTNQPFEFVVSHTPHIDLPPDPGAFRQYFSPNKEVAVFDNLGGDAKLIAPTPENEQHNYAHIGVFTEEAPKSKQVALWETVAEVTAKQISEQTLWLNTAGGGVPWLHVRLDSKPKYYRHQPYIVIE